MQWGNLNFHGDPISLPSRPIHITTDASSRYVLTAYNAAPGLTVHELRADGSIGNEIPHADSFDFGTYPHQVRVTPSNNRAILVDGGVKGFGTRSHVAGSLKVLRFDRGRVENLHTISPDKSLAPHGFNPRHMDFHPTKPLAFVVLEEQNQVFVFRMRDDEIEPTPLSAKNMLVHPEAVQPRQDGGTVHVHPTGKYVYVGNRNDGYVGGMGGPSWLTPNPVPVFPGGENNIAVFAINDSGEPTLIQNEDSRGLHPRTFALDPSGKLLIAANLAPTVLRNGDVLAEVSANLALMRVHDNGRLEFLHRHDIDVAGEMIWWMGIVA